MTRIHWKPLLLILAVVGPACQPQIELRRPDVLPSRMIEPQLQQPATEARPAPDATPIRLLDTHALGQIGRRLIHQTDGGELIQDPVWRWSSMPAQYLDLALRLAAASSRDVRLVDTGGATTVGVTLIVWQLESAGSTHLVGAAELGITTPDRAVRTEIIHASEAVSPNLPGDLAAAAGRLLNTLATESLARASARSPA
jgi:hypothetical protein